MKQRCSKQRQRGRLLPMLLAIITGLVIFPLMAKPVVASATWAPGRIVGHQDVAQIDAYLAANPSVAATIGQGKWFFAHASVGENMQAGMERLNRDNPGRYGLSVYSSGPNPPASLNGGLYSYGRGNPGAAAKISTFEAYLAGGWAQKTHFAMNKFCYIDIEYDGGQSATANQGRADALANQYTSSMARLEAKYPNLRLIYATMPIESTGDNNNFVRMRFNQQVRNFAAAQGKYLLDIADIESHYANGQPSGKTVGGQSTQTMVPEYTNDGGHLTALGETRVALGWYALAAALVIGAGGQNPAPAPVTPPETGAASVLRGADRAATSLLIAGQGEFATAKTLVIVAGSGPIDGVTAAPLAISLKAPVVYAGRDDLGAGVIERIKRGINKIVLVGPVVISDQTSVLLQSLGVETEIIKGVDRFDTAKLVAQRLTGVTGVYIADGLGLADSMAAAVAAGQKNGAVLLSRGSSQVAATDEFLAGKGLPLFTVGGPAAKAYSGTALAGNDRYDTANRVAATVMRQGGPVIATSGTGLVDAVPAAVLAALRGAPLTYVVPGKTTTQALAALKTVTGKAPGPATYVGQ